MNIQPALNLKTTSYKAIEREEAFRAAVKAGVLSTHKYVANSIFNYRYVGITGSLYTFKHVDDESLAVTDVVA